MQTDKKIEEYLERAIKLAVNHVSNPSSIAVIEIAKMIQLEEHNNPEISGIDKPLLEQIKLSRE